MVTDSIKPQLEAKGYKVKLVEFTDYVTPNIALADGSQDVVVCNHVLEHVDHHRALRGSGCGRLRRGFRGLRR